MSKSSVCLELEDQFYDVPFTEFYLTIQDENGNLVRHSVYLDGKRLGGEKLQPIYNFKVILKPNFVRSKLKLISIGLSPERAERGKTLYYVFYWKGGNKQFSHGISFDEYRRIVVIYRITMVQKR